MAVVFPALITAGVAAYNMYDAKEREKKAQRQIDNTPRPTYGINAEEYDNLALRRMMGGQGLPGATRQVLLNNSNQAFSAGVGAILRGGGDPNDINTSYLRYNDSMGRFAMLDDQARVRNIDNFVQERRRMSDNKDKQFQINEYAPYVDNRTAAYGALQGANAQFNQGIGMMGTAAIGASQGLARQQQINDIRYGTGSNYRIGGNSGREMEDQELIAMLSGTGYSNFSVPAAQRPLSGI